MGISDNSAMVPGGEKPPLSVEINSDDDFDRRS